MAQFSVSQLVNTNLKVDAIWRDAQVNQFYKPEVAGLEAIRRNSAATIAPLQDTNKDYTVSIHWITNKNIVAEAAVASCDISGPQLDSEKKDFALDIFLQSSFSVNEDDFRTSIFTREEVVAKGLLGVFKALEEELGSTVLAKADSYAGTNMYLGGYTAAGGKTQIPAATAAVNFFAYLQQAKIINRMRDSYLIENGTMYQQQIIAAYNAGNLDGKGAQAAFGSMDITTDFFNMASAGLTTDALLVSRNALAFGNRAIYAPVPEELGGEIQETRYSVPSPNLPGVRYDVRYTMKCVVNAVKNRVETVHVWQVNLAAGLFLNPVLNAGNTGVLAFDRV